jgi:hypothetical protein
MLLRPAPGIFLPLLWQSHTLDFRGSAEHGPDCRRYHPHAHRLRAVFTIVLGWIAGNVASGSGNKDEDVAFVPLAMPIMFGPGAIATILGMTSTVKHSEFEFASAVAICVAIVATMYVTYLFLAYAKPVLRRIGPRGIDAATRIVGFFVSTMGMGLIFHGLIEAFQTYGVIRAAIMNGDHQ